MRLDLSPESLFIPNVYTYFNSKFSLEIAEKKKVNVLNLTSLGELTWFNKANEKIHFFFALKNN